MPVTTVYEDCTACCGGLITDCCPNALPLELTVTITDKTGDCTCLPDEVTLTWNPENVRWENNTATPGCAINTSISFGCGDESSECGDFFLTISDNQVGADVGCACDPLLVVFSNVDTSVDNPCTGTATYTVTE